MGRKPLCAGAVAILALWQSVAALGESFGNLKGYSIEATYSMDTIPGAILIGQLPPHGLFPVQRHDRIYISVRGNVFNYSDEFGGSFAKHGGQETAAGSAEENAHGRLQAWTVESSRLLQITHLNEGNVVTTFTVDPGKTTCTMSVQMYPDPNTGRVVTQFLMGATGEIRALHISSVTCMVRKGNIFAADQ